MTFDDNTLADRILGGWLGRVAGNVLGKPVEEGDHWTRDRIDRYLRDTGTLPLTDYFPPPESLPEPSPDPATYALHPEWPECTRAGSTAVVGTTTWTTRSRVCTCWRRTAGTSPPSRWASCG